MRGWAASIVIAFLPTPIWAEGGSPPPRPAEDISVESGGTGRRPDPRPEQLQPGSVAQPPHEPEATDVSPPAAEDEFAHAACLLELTLLGAEFSEEAPVVENGQPQCGIARPIRVKAPLPGISIAGDALMRCDTARHLAHWLRDFVRPAAALLPGQPALAGLEPGSTYQCRQTIGTESRKISEHALGNAFDIAAFRFRDGSRIEIAPRQDDGDLTEAFQRTVRASACLHFTTVLGPGANAAHDNHLHLDIKQRNGGYRLCQ